MLIRLLRTYLRPYRKPLSLVLVLQLAQTLATLYLPALNAVASPAAAADIYVTDFERAGIPAASNREAAADAVAAACHM